MALTALVYEMLYKKVYKLPDIEYSVETMLHSDINHEPSFHEYGHGDEYATHIVFQDGRMFELDRPGIFYCVSMKIYDYFNQSYFFLENTRCILRNPDLCHFHNENFEEDMHKDTNRYEKSVLPDKYCSCVRQLLFDGITPFPYKVAKSLDQNIYRNVEFDSWNEARKAFKTNQQYKVNDCFNTSKNNSKLTRVCN